MTAPIKPRLRRGSGIIELGDEGLLYVPSLEQLYYLNPTAAVVLQLCDGTASIAQTSHELAAALGLDPEAVERDVRYTVRQFRRNDVLVTDGADDDGAATRDAPDERERVRMEVPAST